MSVPPPTVSPIHTQRPLADEDSEGTLPPSPEASQSRATPNFSRPLPRGPPGTAPPEGTAPTATGRVITSGSGFSRPLPSVPHVPSHQSLEYTHGGRGSGLGTRIIDDRDPDDDFVIPGPTLRQYQSRSPVLSYQEDGRTSSAATGSGLLYASAPSTPLPAQVELEREIDAGRSSPSGSQVGSQVIHENARRETPERRATVDGGVEAHHDLGEGSLTPKRAATTDYYGRTHSRHEASVPHLPETPKNFQHHSAHDAQEALEYSDDMAPYSGKLVEQFGDDAPNFPEPFAHEQTVDTQYFPEPQPHFPPLVLGLPISDSQTSSSLQRDEAATVPMPFAFPLPPPAQGQHEGAWKSYTSASLDVGSDFGDQLMPSDMSQHRPPSSVIAGTNLEFEPLQSPHERNISSSSPMPHVETPRYAHDSLTSVSPEPPHAHAYRLPPLPSMSTSADQERTGLFHEDKGESGGFTEPQTDDTTPVFAPGASSVAPLRIAKHTRTTPIPPGAAAPTPPAFMSSADVNRIRKHPSTEPAALPAPSLPSSPKELSPSSEGNNADAAELVSRSFDGAGIASSKDEIPIHTQNINFGIHSPLSSDSPTHTKPEPPRPAITTSTGSNGTLSRVQHQPAIPGTPSKVASEETNLAPSRGGRRTPVDHLSHKLRDAQAGISAHPETSDSTTQAELPGHRTYSQPQSQRPQAQKYSPGPPSIPPPSQSKPLPPPAPVSKSQLPIQSDPTSDTTPSGSHKRSSSADTPKPYRTLAEEKAQYNAVPPSSRTQYMQMLLALDDIPMISNLSASFFTWVLLAGFILFPGTFTSLQTLDLGNGVEAALVNRIVNLPLFVVAFICTGIGVIGMSYLWWKWMKNYIWLTNKIFVPGLMNSLAGIISTLSSVYGVQRGEFTRTSIITISVTGGVGAVCGILVLFYGVWMLGLVKKRHAREVGVEKAGKHGEGMWAGFKEKVGKVGRRK